MGQLKENKEPGHKGSQQTEETYKLPENLIQGKLAHTTWGVCKMNTWRTENSWQCKQVPLRGQNRTFKGRDKRIPRASVDGEKLGTESWSRAQGADV